MKVTELFPDPMLIGHVTVVGITRLNREAEDVHLTVYTDMGETGMKLARITLKADGTYILKKEGPTEEASKQPTFTTFVNGETNDFV